MKDNELILKYFETNNIGLEYHYLDEYNKSHDLAYIEYLLLVEQLLLMKQYMATKSSILYEKKFHGFVVILKVHNQSLKAMMSGNVEWRNNYVS